MAGFMDQLSSFLPVPPGTFGPPPPKPGEDGKFSKADRDKQAQMINSGGDMNEAEPAKSEAPAPDPAPRSQMTKPLAPIEAGVEECDLCGRWKSKCRICAALFCEQCSMGEAIRMSHVRRGTVICGQCTVMLDKVPGARIVPMSIPEVNIGPSMAADKAWKQAVLKGASKMPSRPPRAVHSTAPRGKDKDFSPEDLDNDFKYQNLFEVLFSPDLHLLSAMFEVMPEDASGDALLAAILRLVDRSARTEQIMKACVEMEVANTLDATTMFRRNNMSLRILKMHLYKVGAKYLQDALRGPLAQFREAIDRRREAGCTLELDPSRLTPADNMNQNAKDLNHFTSLFVSELKSRGPSSLGKNMVQIFSQLRVLSEARFPNSGHRVVAGLFMVRFVLPALAAPLQHGLTDSAIDPFFSRALKVLSDVLQHMATGEAYPRDSPYAAMNPVIEHTARDMKQLFASISGARDDAWEHSDPKQVMVQSKDVPDLLRLIVNKMEIIERHAYLQEQQHEELRGSFLRLRAAVADLTYSASYSSGVGSRYGAAPMAPLPYETDEGGDWNASGGYEQEQQGGGQHGQPAWNSAAEAALQEAAQGGQYGEFGETVQGEMAPAEDLDDEGGPPDRSNLPPVLNAGMIPPSGKDEVEM